MWRCDYEPSASNQDWFFYARQYVMLRASWSSSRCLSVRLSDCPLHCGIVSKRCKLTNSSLCAAPRTLIFRDKISCPWMTGSPWTTALKRGIPLKSSYSLLARIAWKRLHIDTGMLFMITSTGDDLFRATKIDDLEGPWTPPSNKGY